jgi:site-specific recombinase XerD
VRLADALPDELEAKRKGKSVPIPREVQVALFNMQAKRSIRRSEVEPVTVAELFAIWKAAQQERVLNGYLKATSFEPKHNMVRRFADYFGEETVGAAFPNTKEIRNWWHNPDLKHSYQLRRWNAIAEFFDFAVQKKHLESNPLRKAELGLIDGGRRRTFTEAEIKAIRKHSRPAFRRFFDLLLNTGARPRELAVLEARHLTYGDGVVKAVLAPKEWKNARTGKSRVITFVGDDAETIRRAAKEYPEGKILRTAHGKPWVEASGTSEKKRWTVCMRYLRETHGLAEDCTVYMCRSYFITQQVKSNPSISILQLSVACGTSPKQILKHYLHQHEEIALEVAKQFVRL